MTECCLDGTYGITIDLPDECVADLTASGDCEEAARYWVKQPGIAAQLDKIGHDAMARALKAYGAWTDEELADREWTRLRALWTAAGDVISDEE